MDQEPGTIKRFSLDRVKSIMDIPPQSLHQGNLLETLELAKHLGLFPEELIIFGIEPVVISPGQDLSPVLQQKTAEYLEFIGQELKSN